MECFVNSNCVGELDRRERAQVIDNNFRNLGDISLVTLPEDLVNIS